MRTRLLDSEAWRSVALQGGSARAAYPKAAFLVAPDFLGLAEASASDNRYMTDTSRVDSARARKQHASLLGALARDLPVVMFPGVEGQPDGVFPNNVYATARRADGPAFVVGSMRHEVRRREAGRQDIRDWFTQVLGYRELDLRQRPGISELTGTLVIDRGRGLGVAGLGTRCDEAGAAVMAEAFDLSACLALPMAPSEYHANVVLAVLGSRAAVVCPDGWRDGAHLAGTLAAVYGADAVIELDSSERQGFAGNCIALAEGTVWMSERAADALRPSTLHRLERAGFRPRGVALDEVEKAGGSLRCCVAEIF